MDPVAYALAQAIDPTAGTSPTFTEKAGTGTPNMYEPPGGQITANLMFFAYHNGGSAFTWDPITNVYTVKASQPLDRSGYGAGASLTGLDGVFYTFGGQFNNSPSGNSYKYTLATNSWTSIAFPPYDIRHTTCGAWNGAFYLAGGDATISGNFIAPPAMKYDPVGNVWTTLASQPINEVYRANEGRRNAGGMTDDGRLVIIGGQLNFSATGKMLVYDCKTNTWETTPRSTLGHGNQPAPVHSSYPYKPGGFVAQVKGRDVYFSGGSWYEGYNGGNITNPIISKYNLDTNTWSSIGPERAAKWLLNFNDYLIFFVGSATGKNHLMVAPKSMKPVRDRLLAYLATR